VKENPYKTAEINYMNKTIFLLVAFLEFFINAPAQIELHTGNFIFIISPTGQVVRMAEPLKDKDYLAKGEKAPLMKIRVGDKWEEPQKAVYDPKTKRIGLKYPFSKVSAYIEVTENKSHLAFRLVSISHKDKVNAVNWGPYPVSIGKTIGEVTGVVRDGDYAIGIQALNAKTIGGILKNEGGTDDSRGSAANPQTYGSSLQAYSLDRSHERTLTVWGNQYPDMPVRAIPGETVLGSAIALFGCPEDQVLQRISDIELTWGLPHPLIDGVWHKQSSETGRAYLISDFNESNVDEMLDYTRKAGLGSLYHEGPFQSWGHYILDPGSFPNGLAGMKKCVEKASAKGIRIGVHTLSTFINTNDPYVSPVPDQRLALTGSSTLSEDIQETNTEIPVHSDKYFSNVKPSTLHAVKIGDEIIRFSEVTASQPFKLLNCQRGAFGTKPSAHKKGDKAGMLLDYPYQTLFPDFSLQQEIAGNLANFFNETGVSQLDFDGHEGCMSSGEGEYAMEAFAEKVFRETHHTLVNGTSRSSHFYWHICHYWNWGEPWYGGFRESQGDYRLDNQPFLERNYMPNMLGWFLLSSTTGSEDIEWMMARAAGYKAGFALVARYKSLKGNPETDKLLDLIRLWQEASRSGIFTPEQLIRLKNPANDFHLEKSETDWKLYPFSKHEFKHTKQSAHQGQPTFSEWKFENKDPEQPLIFTLTLLGEKGSILNPRIELDDLFKLVFPGEFESGESVVCDGKSVRVYNNKGKFIKDIPIEKPLPVLTGGLHILRFDCESGTEDSVITRLVIRTRCIPEIIKR
jgi:hypothetical protein